MQECLKQKITDYVNDRYKGTLRFVKSGVLEKIEHGSQTKIKQVVKDTRLHTPVSLLVYCYLNDIHEHPVCKMCGKLVKFNTTKKQFAKYCGNKCRFADMDSIQDIKRKTNLERYGTTNVLVSEHGIKKAKETCIKKYGVDDYTKTDEYKQRGRS